MFKQTLIVFLFVVYTIVNSEAKCDKNHCNTEKPEESKNLPPLITVQTGNPVHITQQNQNNNFYLTPILIPNLSSQPLEIHRYDSNTNILRTIIIIPPKNKKPCDRNSSVSQPPVQTEKPTKSPPCANNRTTEKPTTTIKTTTVEQITKRPCGTTLDTPSTPLIVVTPPSLPTDSTQPEILQTPSTKVTANPTKVTPNPSEVTANPNKVTAYPTKVTTNPTKVTANPTKVTANPTKVTANPTKVTANPNEITPSSTARIPITGDPDGSMKCLQDGVYRANNVTCDQFYVCIHGISYLMDCPYGLVFNDQLKICDWLENVSDCKPPAFRDFTCPNEGYGDDDDLILHFRYRDSCSQYVSCHKRKPRLLTCEPGYYFHDESSTCLPYRSVSNCRDVWYSY